MKLKINKSIRLSKNPDWKSLIGKTYEEADVAINEVWPSSESSNAIGYNGFRCVTYSRGHNIARLFFDENGYVIDVFCYYSEQPEDNMI